MFLKRTLAGFSPADEASVEVARKFKVGETYKADVRKQRNLKHHRRYWALVRLIYENSEQFSSAEQVHQYLKIRSGHCTQIASQATGEIFLVPDSINFDNVDDVKFQEIWQRMVDIVCAEIIPGIAEDEISLEIEKLVGVAG